MADLTTDLTDEEVDSWLHEKIWLAFGGTHISGLDYEVVGDDEYPDDMDGSEIVLRAPNGRMFEVTLMVSVYPFEPQAGGAA